MAGRLRTEYKKRYLEDPSLPSNPPIYYGDSGWSGWHEFLGKPRTNCYPSYDEAKSAVKSLNINSYNEYIKRYHEDPRLSSRPNFVYAGIGWSGWREFCGKSKHYSSYEEAQLAAQALSIKTQLEYRILHKKDPRLPASPHTVYEGRGWTNWYDFLGTGKYKYYIEAQKAVQALGILSQLEYKERYREDPKLPSAPYEMYADQGWEGWPSYLGSDFRNLYESYAEAQLAAQIIGIKSQSEYVVRCREDPRLPTNPHTFYADKGWVDWYHFLGKKNPRVENSWPNLWTNCIRWLKNETGIPTKKAALRAFLGGYCQEQELPDDVLNLLRRSNSFDIDAYKQFIDHQAESKKQPFHRAIKSFLSWLLSEYCTDSENKDRIVLPEYHNPLETELPGFSDGLGSYKPKQSTKPPLGYEYILRARNYLVPNGEQALQSRPTLRELHHLQDFFNSSIDWVTVDESAIDYDDPNCIWRKIEKSEHNVDGKKQSVAKFIIWSPVRFVALYALLRFPLRGQQILWLDSGEADAEIATLHSGGVSWEKNTSPLTGYGSNKRPPQAAVQRGEADAPTLWVTTNKTGRFDKGYGVEWIPDDLIYFFLLLRDWQIKYNPLKTPTRWSEISLATETNKKVLNARGSQCFLFRTDCLGQPISTNQAFANTLPALLYAIQRPGENLAIELPYRVSGKHYTSHYTPHSLRVSLITAFIIDGGAPIHLISKLVGHASLVMTIYYTKFSSNQMRRTMGETEKRTAQASADRHAEIIRTQGLLPLRHQLIATDGNRSLLDADTPSSACIVFDYGICPMSAASCHVGGDPVSEKKSDTTVYASVEAGYLGQKNCPRCRFFITGVPFAGGLVALANELALEIHTESNRFQNFTSEVNNLDAAYYDACQIDPSYAAQGEIKKAIACQQQSASKLDGLLKDYVSVNHYVQSCLKLINESQGKNESEAEIRLVTTNDFSEFGVSFEESGSNYHLLAEICQNAKIYRSTNPSRAIPLISHAIDRMIENNGLPPAMYRLDDEQKLIVANELNRLLLQRLGSWEKIDNLFSGDLMLLDIDAHEPKLTRISAAITNIFSESARCKQLNQEALVNE